MAAFYTNHGRFKEAEAIYRERLAQQSLNTEERLSAMTQLVGFLSAHGDKAGAIALQEQLITLRGEQPMTTPELRDRLAQERYVLANLKVDAGQSDDARTLLASDLQQAEAQHGRNSPEYGEALNYFFENSFYAKDLDLAEKLAREEIERAEASDASERVGLVAAIFRLSDVLREQGKIGESDDLRKRGIDMNRAAFPQAPSTAQFAVAEKLVAEGKPREAVWLARQISESPAQSDRQDEQFGFHHLAQSLASEQKADAAEVASIALSAGERRMKDSPRLVRHLTDWANFYRGMLGQKDRAGDLLTRAEAIVRACCGIVSLEMQPVLQERAWLEDSIAGPAASIPYLEQMRTLQISLYGARSQAVEQTNRELAKANARLGR
ncbi:MAG: hypothetical protein QOJ99_5595 [Bryobacterales bacterium]|nr:hypothetical protein [Bryobacterales bacterium]